MMMGSRLATTRRPSYYTCNTGLLYVMQQQTRSARRSCKRDIQKSKRGSGGRQAYRELAAPVLIVRPPGPLAERAKDIARSELFQ
jgi:hypothetical protein